MLHSRRQTLRLPKPNVQLKLPIFLLLFTLAFGVLMAWHTHAAYERIYTTAMSNVAPSIREDLSDQTRDFAVVSGALLGGYALVVLGFCIAYTHYLIGPTIALQRQARRLRSGDFSARTQLRRTDVVFTELAGDLNAVAELLQKHAGSVSPADWRS